MKLQRFAEQDAQARARIVDAVRALPFADPELVAAVENANHRDPNVRVLREHQAIADLLESLTDVPPAPKKSAKKQ